MIFGFDFDETFAADVPSFRAIVALLQAAGHICIVVTNRAESNGAEVIEVVAGQLPILFANGHAKHPTALLAGYDVDIWVDDNPVLVDFGQAGLDIVSKKRKKKKQDPMMDNPPMDGY